MRLEETLRKCDKNVFSNKCKSVTVLALIYSFLPIDYLPLYSYTLSATKKNHILWKSLTALVYFGAVGGLGAEKST